MRLSSILDVHISEIERLISALKCKSKALTTFFAEATVCLLCYVELLMLIVCFRVSIGKLGVNVFSLAAESCVFSLDNAIVLKTKGEFF